MRLDYDAINKMSVQELEETLEKLKNEDKYPHLATLIAYALTYHFYYIEVDDTKAKKFYDDVLALLNIPPGYGWCYVSVHMLANAVMPHYLHAEVMKRNFSRLAWTGDKYLPQTAE